jgi:hypothetical protein
MVIPNLKPLSNGTLGLFETSLKRSYELAQPESQHKLAETEAYTVGAA